jgi:hypothetical protein
MTNNLIRRKYKATDPHAPTTHGLRATGETPASIVNISLESVVCEDAVNAAAAVPWPAGRQERLHIDRRKCAADGWPADI